MRKIVFWLTLMVLIIVGAACNALVNESEPTGSATETSGIILPDGIVPVAYFISDEESYMPYGGAPDIYQAIAEDISGISLVDYEKEFGEVANARTAVDIASLVFSEVYFDCDCCTGEAPFCVHFNQKANAWVVSGTLPMDTAGGVGEIVIEKDSGQILMLLHTE